MELQDRWRSLPEVIGQSIAAALRATGQPYRVVGRARTALETQYGADPLAEIVTWNPDEPDSVRAAAQNIETIVYTVGVPYTDFYLHPILMRKTLAGATAAGVKQLLLIGTIYPYGRPQTDRVREDHPRAPHTVKGQMRKEQEDILDLLRKSERFVKWIENQPIRQSRRYANESELQTS